MLPQDLFNINTQPTEQTIVPNQFPSLDTARRLAIIGEAPGAEEIHEGQPFVGYSGQLLNFMLSKVGISRQECFIGNVCQHRPKDNKIATFAWEGNEIQTGLAKLTEDLKRWKPNCVLLLGSTAFYAATGKRSMKNTDYRGSLFTCTLIGSPFFGMKCLCSIHPAAILRQMKHEGQPADSAEQGCWKQLLLLDITRAVSESTSPELVLPQRNINTRCNFGEIMATLHTIEELELRVSIDIEGGLTIWSAISFAWSPNDCIVIPLTRKDGSRFWSESQDLLLIPLLSRILANSRIKKILQNALYDAFVLGYGYKIQIAGICDDAMLKSWELFPELPKALAVIASIYTREPYWKDKIDGSFEEFLLYNGLDSAVTYEIVDAIKLADVRDAHYRLNVSLLNAFLYTELAGMPYDTATASKMLTDVKNDVYTRTHALHKITGGALTSTTDLFLLIKDTMCYKNIVAYELDDLLTKPKKEFAVKIHRAVDLAKRANALTDAEFGELESVLHTGLNVDSPQQLCHFLYHVRGYSPMYKKVGGRLTDKETADELALLKLYVKYKEDSLIFDILILKKLTTSMETLEASTDRDGHMRCGYNIVGTDTGRLACYTSPTGSGYNLQTVTRKHRKLFTAKPAHYFFEVDLSGADGWTVAAYMAMLGDRTMLDDYLFGLKPANIIALMYEQGAAINSKTRAELKTLSKTIDPKGWLYFAAKRGQHGSTYGLGPSTMSDQILKDSYKLYGVPILVTPPKCEQLQSYFHARYVGIKRYQGYIANEIKTNGCLIAASGSKRIFFGKRDDYDTIRSAFSHLPQHNTTYCIKLGIRNCWADPENRVGSSLIVKPLHQVHDSFNGQFPCDRVEWALTKICSWMNNPLTIAGQVITIPFEGGYGPSWGERPYSI